MSLVAAPLICAAPAPASASPAPQIVPIGLRGSGLLTATAGERSVIAWSGRSASGERLHLLVREPGGDGAWHPIEPAPVVAEARIGSPEALALSGDGTVHAAWHTSQGGRWSAYVASYRPGVGWDPPLRIDGGDHGKQQVAGVRIAAGAGGAATAAWAVDRDIEPVRLTPAMLLAQGPAWSSAMAARTAQDGWTIGPRDDQFARRPVVAIGEPGDGLIAWHGGSPAGPNAALSLSRPDGVGGWSWTSLQASPAAVLTGQPQRDEVGRVHLLTQSRESTSTPTYLRLGADGTVLATEPVPVPSPAQTSGHQFGGPAAAVAGTLLDRFGRFVVLLRSAWSIYPGDNGRSDDALWAATANVDGGWHLQRVDGLISPSVEHGEPMLTTTADGRSMAVWHVAGQPPACRITVFASVLGDGGWSPRRIVAETTAQQEFPACWEPTFALASGDRPALIEHGRGFIALRPISTDGDASPPELTVSVRDVSWPRLLKMGRLGVRCRATVRGLCSASLVAGRAALKGRARKAVNCLSARARDMPANGSSTTASLRFDVQTACLRPRARRAGATSLVIDVVFDAPGRPPAAQRVTVKLARAR